MRLVVFADTSAMVNASSLSSIFRVVIGHIKRMLESVPADRVDNLWFALVKFGKTVEPEVIEFVPLQEYCETFDDTFTDFNSFGRCNFSSAMAMLKGLPENDVYTILFLTNGNPTDSDWKKELKKLKESEWYTQAIKIAIYFEGYVDSIVLKELAGGNVYKHDAQEMYMKRLDDAFKPYQTEVKSAQEHDEAGREVVDTNDEDELSFG